MRKDALPDQAALSRSDRHRNLCIKDSDVLSDACSKRTDDVLGIVRAAVHHRQQDPVDLQIRIDAAFDLGYRTKQKIQTFRGQEVWLRRYDHAVCGHQCVDCHHPQRRHAVDQNVVVILPDRVDIIPQDILKILIVRPIYFDKSVFLTRRNVMILIEQRYI